MPWVMVVDYPTMIGNTGSSVFDGSLPGVWVFFLGMMRFIENDKIDVFYLDVSMTKALI